MRELFDEEFDVVVGGYHPPTPGTEGETCKETCTCVKSGDQWIAKCTIVCAKPVTSMEPLPTPGQTGTGLSGSGDIPSLDSRPGLAKYNDLSYRSPAY